MYLNSQQSQQQNTCYNRSIHSDSYFNPREKITITENKLANTYNPNGSSVPHTPLLGTLRHGTTRLKFGRYISSTGSDAGSDYSDHRDEQLYVKVGETTPPITTNCNNSNNQWSMTKIKLKDPDVIYAPGAGVNRNVISYLSKKDFRDDV